MSITAARFEDVLDVLYDGGYIDSTTSAVLRETSKSCHSFLQERDQHPETSDMQKLCRIFRPRILKDTKTIVGNLICSCPAGIEYAIAHPANPSSHSVFLFLACAYGTLSQFTELCLGNTLAHFYAKCTQAKNYVHICSVAMSSSFDSFEKFSFLLTKMKVKLHKSEKFHLLSCAVQYDVVVAKKCLGLLFKKEYLGDNIPETFAHAVTSLKTNNMWDMVHVIERNACCATATGRFRAQLRDSLASKGDRRFLDDARFPVSERCTLIAACGSGCAYIFFRVLALLDLGLIGSFTRVEKDRSLMFSCLRRSLESKTVSFRFISHILDQMDSGEQHAYDEDEIKALYASAAVNGNLQALIEFPSKFGLPWNYYSVFMAAHHGHLEIVKYAMKTNCMPCNIYIWPRRLSLIICADTSNHMS
jgi:hypothetical protein